MNWYELISATRAESKNGIEKWSDMKINFISCRSCYIYLEIRVEIRKENNILCAISLRTSFAEEEEQEQQRLNALSYLHY